MNLDLKSVNKKIPDSLAIRHPKYYPSLQFMRTENPAAIMRTKCTMKGHG